MCEIVLCRYKWIISFFGNFWIFSLHLWKKTETKMLGKGDFIFRETHCDFDIRLHIQVQLSWQSAWLWITRPWVRVSPLEQFQNWSIYEMLKRLEPQCFQNIVRYCNIPRGIRCCQIVVWWLQHKIRTTAILRRGRADTDSSAHEASLWKAKRSSVEKPQAA